MSTKIKQTATRSVEDVDTWDDHLEKLIDVFKPFLLEKLRVSHLLCLIHLKEVKDVAAMIHRKENSGNYQEASSDLLEAIMRSDERGKWQMFIDALKEVKNTVILQTLLDEKSDDLWLDDQGNRKLIELFSQDIEGSLMLGPLLGKMLQKELISHEDMINLRALIRDGKEREAIAVLILLMHRNSTTWFSDFLTILYEEDEHHMELAKLIDPGFCEKKQEQKKLLAAMGKQSSAAEHGAGDVPTQTPSMVSNSGGGEKDLGDKSLPQAQQPHHAGYEGQTTPAGRTGEATCTCQCCAKVLAEVASLRSELAELKSLIGRFVANGKQHT